MASSWLVQRVVQALFHIRFHRNTTRTEYRHQARRNYNWRHQGHISAITYSSRHPLHCRHFAGSRRPTRTGYHCASALWRTVACVKGPIPACEGPCEELGILQISLGRLADIDAPATAPPPDTGGTIMENQNRGRKKRGTENEKTGMPNRNRTKSKRQTELQ